MRYNIGGKLYVPRGCAAINPTQSKRNHISCPALALTFGMLGCGACGYCRTGHQAPRPVRANPPTQLTAGADGRPREDNGARIVSSLRAAITANGRWKIKVKERGFAVRLCLEQERFENAGDIRPYIRL
jgi:hypothetical protein